MSVYHPHVVQCACGQSLTVYAVDTLNGGRSPAARQAIIDGKFHRTKCASCGMTATIDKPFLYADFSRRAFFRVIPTSARHLWRHASATLNKAVAEIPAALLAPDRRQLRVVAGLGELREKLIAQDAGLDDRISELLKVFVIADHPFLVKTPRLRLTLNKASPDYIEYHASFDHSPGRYLIGLPHGVTQDLLNRQVELKGWSDAAHGSASLFNLKDDHWINLWRFSPQPAALERLHVYAEQIRAGHDIDTLTEDFAKMIGGLPTGSHLPLAGKEDLGVLFDYAARKSDSSLESALLHVRFGTILSDDWALNNDPDHVATLYKLLKGLPESNVEGNISLHELILDNTSGGIYDPTTHDIHIGIGLLSDDAEFEETVRHEVGHAVEDAHYPAVDSWRTGRFGWQMLATAPGSDDWKPAIDHWVALMGGWKDLTDQQQDEVRGCLLTALGTGSSWTPGAAPNPPQGHPWWSADFGPRLAFTQSGANWYENYRKWYTWAGKAFFMNFWYRTFTVVDLATLDLVDKMPSNYASMSSSEFFAELYATFYDVNQPKRNDIPQDVQNWLVSNIGDPRPGAPLLKAPAVSDLATQKPSWYFTIRPQ